MHPSGGATPHAARSSASAAAARKNGRAGAVQTTRATLDDYRRLRLELVARSIKLEWRTSLTPDEATNKHDRWLRIDDTLWDVPPLALILSGDYGSMNRDANSVPLDDWWQQGSDPLAAPEAPLAAAG